VDFTCILDNLFYLLRISLWRGEDSSFITKTKVYKKEEQADDDTKKSTKATEGRTGR
jgi:hypothetical protein